VTDEAPSFVVFNAAVGTLTAASPAYKSARDLGFRPGSGLSRTPMPPGIQRCCRFSRQLPATRPGAGSRPSFGRLVRGRPIIPASSAVLKISDRPSGRGDVLRSGEAAGASHPLEVGLGMDISGRPRLLNLSDLPHLLIAGATGAGKSSCINSIVSRVRSLVVPSSNESTTSISRHSTTPHPLRRHTSTGGDDGTSPRWSATRRFPAEGEP
jgi:hypothetical protein